MVVYTAITSGYDTFKEPDASYQDIEFIAYIEDMIKGEIWKTRQLTREYPDPNLDAKKYKVLSHQTFPDAEYTLWIDGSIRISASPAPLISQYLGDADMAVFAHPHRICIYQEAAECITKRLDNPRRIYAQVARYTQCGYPENNGLAEATIILRRNTEKVRCFNEIWWEEIINGSRRDQISLDYAAWKTQLKYKVIKGAVNGGKNGYFHKTEHLKKASQCGR